MRLNDVLQLVLLMEGPREDYVINNMGGRVMDAASNDRSASNKGVAEIVDDLRSMDPSRNGRYLQWIARQYISGLFRLEDAPRIKKAITDFDRFKPRLEVKDINKLTLHELERLVDAITSGSGDVATKETPYDGLKNVKYLYKGPLGILAVPQTEEASCELGRGTKWCTASDNNNQYHEYTKDGDLYIWIDRSGKKFQFWWNMSHKDGEEDLMAMDAQDVEIDDDELEDMVESNPVLKKFFASKRKEVADNIDPIITKAREAIKSRERMTSEDELALIHSRYVSLISEYNAIVIQGRWPAYEDKLLKDDNMRAANQYAVRTIRGRWPELEQVILDRNLAGDAMQYAALILKGRWKEAEPMMLKYGSAEVLYRYAVYNLRRRWPEAEEVILNSGYAKGYLRNFPDADPNA